MLQGGIWAFWRTGLIKSKRFWRHLGGRTADVYAPSMLPAKQTCRGASALHLQQLASRREVTRGGGSWVWFFYATRCYMQYCIWLSEQCNIKILISKPQKAVADHQHISYSDHQHEAGTIQSSDRPFVPSQLNMWWQPTSSVTTWRV